MPSRRGVPIGPGSEEPELLPFSLRGILKQARETGALWPTASGLIFLMFLVVPAWQDYPAPRALATTIAAIVFGALYVGAVGVRAYPRRYRLGWLGAIWVNVAVMAVLIGQDVVFLVMYVVVLHAVLLSWRAGRAAVVVLGLAGLAGAIAIGEEFAMFLAIAGVIMALVLGFGIEKEILERRAEQAEQRVALLAVAAERERIGRDLHDILGHSLTTITVSAQLAQRLVGADPAAASEQIGEIERISRQALADVRATASGMQTVRAATEIASARSVLTAAGIEPVTPTALPLLPDAQAELLGYVIREGVTNVVRHSRAARCTISLDERSATIADDGVGIPAGRERTGLTGLQRRVEAAGGTLSIGPGESGGTILRAELPPEPQRRGTR